MRTAEDPHLGETVKNPGRKKNNINRKGRNIMTITIELNTWKKLFDNSWSGARDTLREIEEQGREEEALAILEELFDVAVCGKIPSETDVNDFIWFELADVMNLYGDEEDK